MRSDDRALRIGTSGWSHRDWVGQLYPHDMPAADYLSAYAQHFATVEIESTFYDIPSPQTVQAWYHRTPDDFLFCPCVPRAITHDQRLAQTSGTLETFLNVISGLGEKLGPLLLQLPDHFRYAEREWFEAFLQSLPSHFQFAVEFRHGSWIKETTFTLLESHEIAWVVVDAPFLPRIARVTAPFAYVRWHGRPGIAQRTRHEVDPASAWRPWLTILRDLQRQCDRVYGFVRNSFSGYAPRDCQTMLHLAGESTRME
jgi:uncharacterized protein YecE (DUF72 family)